MTTNLGRVVYDRKPHAFRIKDVIRIIKGISGYADFSGFFSMFLAILVRFMLENEPKRERVFSAMVAFFAIMVTHLGESLYDVYNELGDYMGVPRPPYLPPGR